MSRRARIAAGAAAVVLAAAAALYACASGLLPPVWVEWRTAELQSGEPEAIVLKAKRVRVYDGGAPVWQSDRSLRVQDVLWCDIDHDGRQELLLLCWRRGRYGQSRPFWVTEDEKRWSQHIYIYDWTADGVRPIWMASDIGMEAAAWRFDETQRLVITDTEGNRSAWDWISWGLSRIALRGEDEAPAG